jgi:hypothetical protein
VVRLFLPVGFFLEPFPGLYLGLPVLGERRDEMRHVRVQPA